MWKLYAPGSPTKFLFGVKNPFLGCVAVDDHKFSVSGLAMMVTINFHDA